MSLNPSSYSGGATGDSDTIRGSAKDPSEVAQPCPSASIYSGEKSGRSNYYDCVYVAFWRSDFVKPGVSPCPVIDTVTISHDWKSDVREGCSLRLYGQGNSIVSGLPRIIKGQKFSFSWLSDIIPNPRAIFYISGMRYVCEKITATFSENGMSQLIKGEFYPLAL